MAIPSLLEADVLLDARDRFLSERSVRTVMGVRPGSSRAEIDRALRRYCKAAVKNARDHKLWPKSASEMDL